ncbi:serine/threonine-protein kinase atg1-like [Aphidius gifuensis]|uniref:serine/threonine-protein kinase atg1-like n=1 Tax=Aphidius gifuensis TaxID=684658 RepID=UPI001CDB7CD9|nr:serine/threonine-protein kinase atg1-like [Aphidius gifuensis]
MLRPSVSGTLLISLSLSNGQESLNAFLNMSQSNSKLSVTALEQDMKDHPNSPRDVRKPILFKLCNILPPEIRSMHIDDVVEAVNNENSNNLENQIPSNHTSEESSIYFNNSSNKPKKQVDTKEAASNLKALQGNTLLSTTSPTSAVNHINNKISQVIMRPANSSHKKCRNTLDKMSATINAKPKSTGKKTPSLKRPLKSTIKNNNGQLEDKKQCLKQKRDILVDDEDVKSYLIATYPSFVQKFQQH